MEQQAHRTRDVYRHFFGAYKARTVLMICLMVVAGLAEGVGVITLIPVLEFASPSAQASGGVGGWVLGVLALLHLPPTLGVLLGMIVVAISLKAGFLLLAQQQVGFTVAGVTRDLRLQIMRSLFDVRWTFFQRRSIGQFANSVTNESMRAASSYNEACALVASVIQMVAYFAVAAMISWKVAVATIVVGLGLTVLAKSFINQSRAAGVQETVGSRNLSARLIDVLQGIKPLKAMGRQGLVWPLLEHETEGLNVARRRQISAAKIRESFQEPILTVLLALGIYGALGLSGRPFSSMLVLAFIFYRVMVHINTLQVRYQVMVVGESAFFALWNDLVEARAHHESLGGSRQFTGMTKGIRFENVSFAYGDNVVLDGVDAEIPVGSFVSILGPSGAGKTTLADLVVGLYPPNAGSITVDGTPLEEFEISSWRRSIGYVPQEMLLFNESVFMNVTLGDPAFSREDAERALRQAGALDFVMEKGGLDHQIGERGGMLSGGQRQRIAIARALVGRPSLMILDEVTAALDPVTEQAICETLMSLSHQTTVLSISHQPAMQEAADISYTLKDGTLQRSSEALV